MSIGEIVLFLVQDAKVYSRIGPK